jgi:sirohydrochlorin ferrochelatase
MPETGMSDFMTIAGPMPKPLPDAVAGRIGVVLAAHGSQRRPAANAMIAAHAERMRKAGPFSQVSAVFLMGDGGVSDMAAADMTADTVLIVPFMMSDGFLAGELSAQISHALNKDGARRRIIVTAPVGTHDDVSTLARDAAERALSVAGHEAATSTLVLVGHGSKGRGESKACAEAHAARLRAQGAFQGGFQAVELAMLEEPPFMHDVLARIDGPAAVVGLFAAPGGHAVDDVQAAIAARADAQIVDAGPVGQDPRMAEIAVLRALQSLEN